MGLHWSRSNGYVHRSYPVDRSADNAKGYNMAKNLQAKLPSSDTLRIYDINTDSVNRFAQEIKALGNGASVTVADGVRDAAEDSVCSTLYFLHIPSFK